MSRQRLNYARQAPELFKKYVEFSMAIGESSSRETALHDLVPL